MVEMSPARIFLFPSPLVRGIQRGVQVQCSLLFPKRPKSRGFRNQKEGGAGFRPILPGSVSEGSVVVVVAPIDLAPIQSSTSVIQSSTSVHFGVHPPPRGSRRYTKKSGTPRGGALGDTQRNLGPFFLGLTTLLVFLGAEVLLYSSKVLN